MINTLVKIIGLQVFMLAVEAQAADTTNHASTGMFKMIMGLAVVLLILAVISWAVKKYMPGISQQTSVIRVVGGTSLGTREKVVVLEVAGRWIVVGVGAGQMTALADLEAGEVSASSQQSPMASTQNFASWLKASSSKLTDSTITEKKDGQE
jgi:flagellar protein FliO/FliZ